MIHNGDNQVMTNWKTVLICHLTFPKKTFSNKKELPQQQ